MADSFENLFSNPISMCNYFADLADSIIFAIFLYDFSVKLLQPLNKKYYNLKET